MKNDGKRLEALVSFVEEHLVPDGATVQRNKLIYDNGVPIAEFDVIVELEVTDGQCNSWLIECRDRPSDGPAPASWIAQLIGLKLIRKFNKVTAVSTTGFSHGAILYAKEHEIELRTVREVSSDQFEWKYINGLSLREHKSHFKVAKAQCLEGESKERKQAFYDAVMQKGNQALLKRTAGSEAIKFEDVFNPIMAALNDRIVNLDVGKIYPISIDLHCDDSGKYFVETRMGLMAIQSMHFEGIVEMYSSQASVEHAEQYDKKIPMEEEIARHTTLQTESIDGSPFKIEMYEIRKNGKIDVVLDLN